ncbi:hypothetical protein HA402_004815 [Bradysia odoriphaga]|nr:hypothetical protein HA402_004815 [Bradysia odoriphaga]
MLMPTVDDYVTYDLTAAENVVDDPHFKFIRRNVIFIHGWQQSPDSPASQTLFNAYLVNGSFNILALDWSETASNIFLDQVAHKVEPLGIAVALFIERWNLQKGIPYSSMHLVGHSLGAHLAGSTGKNIQEWSNQTNYIDRITGLDPAFIADDFLQWRYARFVDIIHTDPNLAGTKKNTGHVDFWPNKGDSVQPGCPPRLLLFQLLCSHWRAILLYAESVKRAYRAGNFLSTNIDNSSDVIEMGLSCPRDARGVYLLSTNDESLYSQS